MALLLRVVSGGYCPAFGRARQRSRQNEESSTFLVVQHSGLGVVLGHVARVLAAAIVSVPALAGKVVVAYLGHIGGGNVSSKAKLKGSIFET